MQPGNMPPGTPPPIPPGMQIVNQPVRRHDGHIGINTEEKNNVLKALLLEYQGQYLAMWFENRAEDNLEDQSWKEDKKRMRASQDRRIRMAKITRMIEDLKKAIVDNWEFDMMKIPEQEVKPAPKDEKTEEKSEDKPIPKKK